MARKHAWVASSAPPLSITDAHCVASGRHFPTTKSLSIALARAAGSVFANHSAQSDLMLPLLQLARQPPAAHSNDVQGREAWEATPVDCAPEERASKENTGL